MAVKRHFPKLGFLIIFFTIGCLLGTTQIFAPIHEMAHAKIANDHGVAQVAITGWDEMKMNPLSRPAILAGWTMQVILLSVCAFFAALMGISPKRRWITGGLWAGAALVHWIRALSSSDFAETLMASFTQQFPYDPSTATRYYQIYHDKLVDTWGWFGFILFSVLGLTMLFCMIPKKAVSPG